ncbi:MAG: agmatine deiminase family protein, partial [Phycisphaeraceae bacterium]|nr:agmatine deiminase family protein [Phycisphaeraceae bacterium]
MSRIPPAAVLCGAAGLVLSAHLAHAQVIKDGRLIYPQGVPISRATTPVEAEWLRRNPGFGAGTDAVTPPPVGPIHCTAEYEPQEGIIIGWEGGATLNAIQAEMARRITVDAGARVYVSCDNATVQASATTTLTNNGVDMSRVFFLQRVLDSIWMCDYGPRYIYEGDCRAVIDHKYNRSTRVNDDVFPDYFAQTYKKHAFYQLGSGGNQLIHGGGNFQLDAQDRGFATRLIVNENPLLTEPTIVNIWNQYQGLNMTLFTPFPTSVDATQHIDMWMQVIDNNKIVISDWPNNVGSIQDNICDDAAITMQNMGFTVYRVPAFSISGVHYTYTNTVMMNSIMLVPTYTATGNATVGNPSAGSATALAVYQSALPPGKTAIGLNCQNIISLAGAIHCIVRHIPVHKGLPGVNGGLAPTAYLQSPNGGQVLTPGQQFTISWISDDDLLVSAVDLHLSTDGGVTFPTTIATNQSPIGSFSWTVPNINTAQARVRVTARDAVNNTGSDASDANFTIGTPPAPCYANCDQSTGAPL